MDAANKKEDASNNIKKESSMIKDIIRNVIGIYSFFKKKCKVLYSKCISLQCLSSGKNVFFNKVSLLIGAEYIKIGDCTCFGKDLYLTAWHRDDEKRGILIQIGHNCSFGAYNHITASNKVYIGNYVLTGKWVTITDNSHGLTDLDTLKMHPTERPIVSKGPVVISDNVWIGDKATILPSITIGEGSIIAANSVVTKDVPPYCVVGGNPAKILKMNKVYE